VAAGALWWWPLPCLLALLLIGPAGSRAEGQLHTYALRAETAERLIPMIEPLLPEDAAITGRGGHLFVRADAATHEQVRQLLDALDRPPQRLLVQIRDHTHSGTRAEGVDGAARLEAVGEGARLDGQVSVFGSNDARQSTGTDSVQVLAGAPALISSGSALAVPLQGLLPVPGGGLVGQGGLAWVDAARETWLLARATLDGGVIVELAATREALLPGGAGVSGNSLTTTVTGPLGTWFDLGGSRSVEGSDRGAGRVFGTRRLSATATRLQMRVDVLP